MAYVILFICHDMYEYSKGLAVENGNTRRNGSWYNLVTEQFLEVYNEQFISSISFH
jgi:hypothetical protein